MSGPETSADPANPALDGGLVTNIENYAAFLQDIGNVDSCNENSNDISGVGSVRVSDCVTPLGMGSSSSSTDSYELRVPSHFQGQQSLSSTHQQHDINEKQDPVKHQKDAINDKDDTNFLMPLSLGNKLKRVTTPSSLATLNETRMMETDWTPTQTVRQGFNLHQWIQNSIPWHYGLGHWIECTNSTSTDKTRLSPALSTVPVATPKITKAGGHNTKGGGGDSIHHNTSGGNTPSHFSSQRTAHKPPAGMNADELPAGMDTKASRLLLGSVEKRDPLQYGVVWVLSEAGPRPALLCDYRTGVLRRARRAGYV
jgi:hypothetical protein